MGLNGYKPCWYISSDRQAVPQRPQPGRALPKEYRFEGDEVYVTSEGDRVVLTSKSKKTAWQDFFDALDSFDPTFRFERDQPKEQQVRRSIEEWARPRPSRPRKRK
jgi:antitoxin VapB